MAGELFQAAKGLSRALPQARFRRRAGVVVSVQTGYTCTVQIAGDSTSISNVRYFAHAIPRPGQQVWLDTDGYDIVVIGVIAGNGGAAPFCKVWRNSAQTGVTGTVSTPVTWEGSTDVWGMWSSGANITLPMDGVWMVVAAMAYSATSGGTYRACDIYHNTTVLRGRGRLTGTMSAGTPTYVTASTMISAVKGDTISVEGHSDQVNNLTTYSFAQTGQFPFCSVAYLGPAA